MEYRIYRLTFQTAVHLGKGTLESTEYVFGADTLFSALCTEAIRSGQDRLEELLQCFKSRRLLISDAFPYIDDSYYLPKPFIEIKSDNTEGSSSQKKAYKNMDFIEADMVDDFINGSFDLSLHTDVKSKLGKSTVKTSAAIRGEEETKPYRIGVFEYEDNAGLYFIVGCSDEEAGSLMDDLVDGLSYSGIGGERSSGLGRFQAYKKGVPEPILDHIQGDGKRYMTLSISLPAEDDLERVLSDADYQLVRRGGFVGSSSYSDEHRRKKDLYMLASGATMSEKYDGDIYDVSSGGRHPVYRYGIPMFWTLKR